MLVFKSLIFRHHSVLILRRNMCVFMSTFCDDSVLVVAMKKMTRFGLNMILEFPF